MKEKKLLSLLYIVGIVLIPFALSKKPRKDWIIVFLLKAFISSLMGNFIVSKKWLEFPVRFLPNMYKSSLLFDHILFPLLCVYYNQLTFHSSIKKAVSYASLFSGIITILEYFLERMTSLIEYHSWKWYHTFSSLTATFLLVRIIMFYIRNLTKKE